MSEDRKDEIQELYDRINKISKISNFLFYTNIIISLILMFDFKHRDYIVIINIILTLGYVIITNINEMYFNNVAENERRKSLLKESFNINTTLKETNKYYNNNKEPSIEKLGLNCYESAFFTKNVIDKMIPSNIIKICIIVVIYMILMIKLENMDLLLIITQTLFSAEFIIYFIKLCYYKFQLEKVCNEFKNVFFILGLKNENSQVLILDATMDYECLKSYCKISTSSKIFFKNNEKLSKEWNRLLKKIKEWGKIWIII